MAEKKPLPGWVRNWGTFLGLVVLVLMLSWLISLLGNFQKDGKAPSAVGGKGDLVLESEKKKEKEKVEILGEESETPTWEVQILPVDPSTEDELVARLALVDENGPPLPSEQEFFVRWTRGTEVIPAVKGWRVSPDLTGACDLWRVSVSAEGKRSVAMVTVLPAARPEEVDSEVADLSQVSLVPRLPEGIQVDSAPGIAALRRFVRMDVRMGKRSSSFLGGLLDEHPHLGALLEEADIAARELDAKPTAKTMKSAISLVEAHEKLKQIGSSTDEAFLETLMPVRISVDGSDVDVLSASAIVGPQSPDIEQARRRLEKQETELLKPGSASQRHLDAVSDVAAYLIERDRILGCVSEQ